MKIIQKNGFTFTVDVKKTREYYLTNSICNCCGCRNLRAQIKMLSPKLADFLSEFGIDICRPDEAADVEMNDHIDYLFVGYTVTGSMETEGTYETDIDTYHVTISHGKTPYDWFPNEQTEPCFFVSVTGISLPWVLEEPFPHTEEPFPHTEGFMDKVKRVFKKKYY